MTSKAAFLPPVEAGRLSQEDAIMQGRRTLFPGSQSFAQLISMPDRSFVLGGQSDLLLFMACVLPGLVLFYGIVVAVSTHGVGVGTVVDFLRSGLCTEPAGAAGQALARSMRPLLALLPIGFVCIIVDVIWSRGECINFIIQTTIATALPDSSWQWLWVLLNCFASVSISLLLVRLQSRGTNRKECYSQSQWTYLICTSDESVMKQAIRAWRINLRTLEVPPSQLLTLLQPAIMAWRINMEDSEISPQRSTPRMLLSSALHLPFVCVAMAPSLGYVLALNVPEGSPWYLTILGNPLIVAIIKLMITQFAFPPASRKLARLELGVRGGSNVITSWRLAVDFHQSQANSFFVFGVATILVGPVVAVFVLDESCLRSENMFVVSCASYVIALNRFQTYFACQALSRLFGQFTEVDDLMGDWWTRICSLSTTILLSCTSEPIHLGWVNALEFTLLLILIILSVVVHCCSVASATCDSRIHDPSFGITPNTSTLRIAYCTGCSIAASR